VKTKSADTVFLYNRFAMDLKHWLN